METLKKIKVLLGMVEEPTPVELEEAKEQMKFEELALEDGTIVSADALEAGSAVFIMVEEEKQPLPIGEYALADGSLLVVTEEGVIAEIKAAEQKKEDEPVEEDMSQDNSKQALVEAVGMLETVSYTHLTLPTIYSV